MNYFEAMISFLVFLLLLGSFIYMLGDLMAKATEGSNYNEAKIKAEKCSAIIDSFYANSGGEFKGLRIDCFVEGNKIGSKSQGKEAETIVLNRKTKLIQAGSRTELIVEVDPHYR